MEKTTKTERLTAGKIFIAGDASQPSVTKQSQLELADLVITKDALEDCRPFAISDVEKWLHSMGATLEIMGSRPEVAKQKRGHKTRFLEVAHFAKDQPLVTWGSILDPRSKTEVATQARLKSLELEIASLRAEVQDLKTKFIGELTENVRGLLMVWEAARTNEMNDLLRQVRTSIESVKNPSIAMADDEIETEVETVRIPPLGFLKTCWLLLWNTIRHPFQTTIIDMMTGRVIGRKR